MPYTGPSIVDYLNSVNQPSDYASRARLAAQHGIQNYSGTADQNTQLLNTLRGGSPSSGTFSPVPAGFNAASSPLYQNNAGGTPPPTTQNQSTQLPAGAYPSPNRVAQGNEKEGQTATYSQGNNYITEQIINGKWYVVKSEPLVQVQSPTGGTTPVPQSQVDQYNKTNAPAVPATVTGNESLDAILKSVQGLLDSNKAVIPAGLQITPALTQQFLAWAHQAVDPQTQQLIQSEITNINSSLKNLQAQYEAQKGETIQTFGSNLATEQNQAGASGTAFSGLRGLGERNLAASTNRTLASLGANTAYQAGAGARAAAANVGAANAGGINMPSLTGATVGIEGGSRGNVEGGPMLDFSYNPSLYTAGAIPTNQNTAVNNLAANYLSQYGTLAGANSGRSMKDLISGISGLPAGYTISNNL